MREGGKYIVDFGPEDRAIKRGEKGPGVVVIVEKVLDHIFRSSLA